MLPRKEQKNSSHAGICYRIFLWCTLFICLTIMGCKEAPSPPEEVGMVRQKIVVQKDANKPPANSLPTPEADAQHEEKTTQPGTLSEADQQESTSPVSEESQLPTSQSILEGEPKQSTESGTKQEEQTHERSVYSYNPVGKIDPFAPILSSRVVGGSTGLRKAMDKTAPLTPLQKIEIDQVKLVGVIVSPQGNKAMVEDASGKGYILTKGTYIGTNFGKVFKILADKVVIHEEVEDYITGQIKSREVTLEPPQKYENGSMQ